MSLMTDAERKEADRLREQANGVIWGFIGTVIVLLVLVRVVLMGVH